MGRGFAGMDPKVARKIQSKGGVAAHQRGTGHEWTATEAREAGRKGGQATARRVRRLIKAEERGK